MARYQWPVGPDGVDDSAGRRAFNAHFRPSADVRLADGSLAPAVMPAVAPTPPAARARRSRSAAAPPAAPPAGGPELWLPLGPSEVVYGQATNRPSVTGRIRDIAVEPANGNRIYAAAAGGGVWFSADAGRSWRPLDEFLVSPNRTSVTPVGSALACGAIHVRFGAAASGGDDEVWVGSGEPRSVSPGGQPGDNLLGVGILYGWGPALWTGLPGEGWRPDAGGDALRGAFVWRIVASPVAPAPNEQPLLFAVTSDGLYWRPPGRGWVKADGLADGTVTVDVIVTQQDPATVRLWVATMRSVRFAEVTIPLPALADPLPSITFTAVVLGAPLPVTRKVFALGAANELWVLGRTPRARPADPIDPAQLWRIDPTAATPAGTPVGGAPATLFGRTEDSDQSDYDMCLAVHPDHADWLYAGGSGITTSGEWNAGLYRLVVSGAAVTPTLIGVGVHADVHVIRLGPRINSAQPVRRVFVGCDGGLFASSGDGDPGSFLTSSVEMATLEPGFVAGHRTNDGLVVAGMQDNGTCQRVGDSVWGLTQMGDGGGVVYDPTPGGVVRFYRQYIFGKWESSDGTGIAPVKRRGDRSKGSSEEAESNASKFYSGTAALNYGGTTHLLVGSTRPWYSSNWGRSWVTIPTGTDPRRTPNADMTQDVVYTHSEPSFACCDDDPDGRSVGQPGGIITVRLGRAPDDDDGHARVRAHVLWGTGLGLYLATAPPTTGGAWTWTDEVVERIRRTNGTGEGAAVEAGTATPFLPLPHGATDVAVHDPTIGAHGSCYIVTTGAAGPTVDTVWWYDGDGHLVPCGVRNTSARGTWTGDRIVAPAMAVAVDPVHPEIVFVGTSVGVIRGELSFDGSGPKWAWRPFDAGLPETAVNDLTVFADGDLHLLRAAMHGRGVWEIDLDATAAVTARTYLRVYPTDARRRRSAIIAGPPVAGETTVRFDASPDLYVETSSIVDQPGLGPTEGFFYRGSLNRPAARLAAEAVANRVFRMRVLVHHRWHQAAAPGSVRVALVRQDLSAGITDPVLGDLWTALLAVAGGGAPGALPSGWLAAGAQLVANVAAPVSARQPRAATFDVDLTGHPAGRVLFVAVVMSDVDQITGADLVKPGGTTCLLTSDLVLNSRHVAARSVELT